MARLHSVIIAAAWIKLQRIFMEYKNKRNVELSTELGPFLTREKKEKSTLISLYLTNPHVPFYHACTPTCCGVSTILTHNKSFKKNPKKPQQIHQVHIVNYCNFLLNSSHCWLWCLEPHMTHTHAWNVTVAETLMMFFGHSAPSAAANQQPF